MKKVSEKKKGSTTVKNSQTKNKKVNSKVLKSNKKSKLKKKKMLKRKFKLYLLVFVIIFLFFLLLCTKTTKSSSYNVVDEIEGYGYTLDDRDSELYSEYFYELKSLLDSEDIDLDQYARYISKMFIIDFYSLDNKISKYDVGGLEFLQVDIVDNFKLKAEDTLYDYIGYIDNKQLPKVESIEVSSLEESFAIYNLVEYDSYELILSWEYSEDLGYDKTGSITLINNDGILEIVEFIGGDI